MDMESQCSTCLMLELLSLPKPLHQDRTPSTYFPTHNRRPLFLHCTLRTFVHSIYLFPYRKRLLLSDFGFTRSVGARCAVVLEGKNVVTMSFILPMFNIARRRQLPFFLIWTCSVPREIHEIFRAFWGRFSFCSGSSPSEEPIFFTKCGISLRCSWRTLIWMICVEEGKQYASGISPTKLSELLFRIQTLLLLKTLDCLIQSVK